jgi:hypothetical protein
MKQGTSFKSNNALSQRFSEGIMAFQQVLDDNKSKFELYDLYSMVFFNKGQIYSHQDK